jgi:hypothetical protein
MSYTFATIAGALVTAGIFLAATSPYYGWCFVLAIVAAVAGAVIDEVK